MAEPPVVVVEVVGWDGKDPLPELPLFHSTAEVSFGGSLYIFTEPAIFWLEGWRAFMRYLRGDDETPIQETPLLARFRSFLVRFWGKLGSNGLVRVRWGALVRTASNLRRVAQPHDGAEGGVCSGHGQLATSCLPGTGRVSGGGWGLPVPGLGNSCRGVILPRWFGFITSLPILCVEKIHLFCDCTLQNLCEEYIVKFKDRWNCHLLLRVERMKLLEKKKVKIVLSE